MCTDVTPLVMAQGAKTTTNRSTSSDIWGHCENDSWWKLDGPKAGQDGRWQPSKLSMDHHEKRDWWRVGSTEMSRRWRLCKAEQEGNAFLLLLQTVNDPSKLEDPQLFIPWKSESTSVLGNAPRSSYLWTPGKNKGSEAKHPNSSKNTFCTRY